MRKRSLGVFLKGLDIEVSPLEAIKPEVKVRPLVA